MSFSPSEHLALLCDNARSLVSRTGAHKEQLEALTTEAEADVRSAEAALTGANEHHAHVRDLLDGQIRRAADRARTARELCVGARQDHVAALQLLGRLESDHCAAEGWLDRPPHAVLVVDDSEDVRELVARVLQNAGFVVRTAANGLEGIIAAYEMRPGVIVMDVTMPVLNGIEATRLIKSFEATRQARIIAFTGNPSIERLADESFVAVLQKPAAAHVVLAAVKRAAGA